MTVKTIAMRAHSNLIRTTLLRQAAGLKKALMEAIMNSLDAGTSEVRIEIKPTKVVIADDGCGIQSEKEVKEHIATLATPHDASEKKIYGEFRLGRGQLFAYGKNTWRTGPFRLTVDVSKSDGVPVIKQKTLKTKVAGCTVTIELYERLSFAEVRGLEDELRQACMLISVPIYVNTHHINKDADTYEWTIETPEYSIKRLGKSTYGGASVILYNQGIEVGKRYVSNLAYGYIINSKVPFKVNVARNEVMQNCPVYRRVLTELEYGVRGRIRDPRKFDDLGDMIKEVMNDTATDSDYGQLYKTAWIPRTDGRKDSLIKLSYGGRDSCIKVIFAEKGCRKADAILQREKRVLVIPDSMNYVAGEQYWQWSMLDNLEKSRRFVAVLEKIANKQRSSLQFKAEKLESEYRKIDHSYEIIPQKVWTHKEKGLLMLARAAGSNILTSDVNLDFTEVRVALNRQLQVGLSTSAKAWTDGQSHITFDRQFLKRLQYDVCSLNKLVLVYIHELCHYDASSGTHEHTPEFYAKYHDWTMYLAGNMLARMQTLIRSKRFNKYLTGKAAMAEARAAEDLAAATA